MLHASCEFFNLLFFYVLTLGLAWGSSLYVLMMSLNLISLSITLHIPYTEHSIIYERKNINTCKCTNTQSVCIMLPVCGFRKRKIETFNTISYRVFSTLKLLAYLNIITCICTWSRWRFFSKPVLFVTQYSKQVQILCCC